MLGLMTSGASSTSAVDQASRITSSSAQQGSNSSLFTLRRRPPHVKAVVLWTREEANAEKSANIDDTGIAPKARPKLRLDFILRNEDGEMILKVLSPKRALYESDLRQGRRVVTRFIQSKWEDDTIDVRSLYLKHLQSGYFTSIFAPAISILESLEHVGPFLGLCSCSYKAVIWLGEILEGIRNVHQNEIVQYLANNPKFQHPGRKPSFKKFNKQGAGNANKSIRASSNQQETKDDGWADTSDGEDEDQGGDKEDSGDDDQETDDECYNEARRLADEAYPTVTRATAVPKRLNKVGDSSAGALGDDMVKLFALANQLATHDRRFAAGKAHTEPEIVAFLDRLAQFQKDVELHGIDRDDEDNGGIRLGHNRLGFGALAELKRNIEKWTQWTIEDVLVKVWNCAATIARNNFVYETSRKGKGSLEGKGANASPQVVVGYVIDTVMWDIVLTLTLTIEASLKRYEGKGKGRHAGSEEEAGVEEVAIGATGHGEAVVGSKRVSSALEAAPRAPPAKKSKLTLDATLQELGSAMVGQLSRKMAVDLAKKLGVVYTVPRGANAETTCSAIIKAAAEQVQSSK
ncbi:BZ3500_MvSof-1268-A1-R1_Chr3-1g06085 [Microbotryum saponariae]|uniref:BZ3500_MvSof-1268-A1-R1_Chr3-1g06085 protein n=1 Tax=Microbotryum saponariae TaxID=289078 RepID=A0A2X0M495_9BASI|nr:BZ3500_MvSof-1268-A1-R1_Chr3-1g06085 [Microbotryum saponariae]SDA03935.1 BZ3501_MvSof-1269-A2-R1_Chr3-2g05770 [Microbotryum saponariae]